MSSTERNATIVWILSLLTLISVLNLVNALMQLNLNGTTANTQFTVFSMELSTVNTDVYFWISATLTFTLFSLTTISIYRGLPLDPRTQQRLFKIEEALATNTNMVENTQIGFFAKIEDAEKTNAEAFRKINLCLENNQKQVAENLAQQKTTMERIENQTEKNTDQVKKQASELTELKKNIEEIATLPEKPKLTGKTKLENFKNISPEVAAKLNRIMITNASEFLANDSLSIAQKIHESPETIANMQAMAQLLMVPGIDEKHSELLVKVGIISRRELANQDPVHLYRSLNAIAKTYVEEQQMTEKQIPTIEEVQSWIKQAQF